MKKALQTLGIVLVFVCGLLVMFYPNISNWYNQRVSSYAISSYQQAVDNTADYAAMMEQARAFNDTLTGSLIGFTQGSDRQVAYESSLNVVNGMMGFLLIDCIDVNLPIYHGTEESVLQKAIGHLEGSALPTGDVGNHVVLSGHTGLPSAELLTNLDQMQLGDTFELHILDEVFVYQVSTINVVEPYEVDTLVPVADKDLVTLVTCTPYGVNSHRLLVTGERVETTAEETADPVAVEPVAVEQPETSTLQSLTEGNLLRYVPLAVIVVVLLLVAVLLYGEWRKMNRY